MNLIKNNINKIIIACLIIVLCGTVGLKYYLNNKKEGVAISKEKEIKISKKEVKGDDGKKSEKIFVDIKGAIKKPGVYEIEANKKVIDVVYLAGGLSDEADTTLVNLAKRLSDEMVIIIYTKDQIKEAKKQDLLSVEVNGSCVCPKIANDACINNNNTKKSSSSTSSSSSKSSSSSSSKSDTTSKTSELVNINTASKEELQTISGIGEGKAQAIIDYREENGNFNSIEDILNVSGIGESIYEKIKDSITV